MREALMREIEAVSTIPEPINTVLSGLNADAAEDHDATPASARPTSDNLTDTASLHVHVDDVS